MGDLDRLQTEVNNDLLDEWIAVYDVAEEAYQALPERTRRWIAEHGHRVESLASVIVMMQPDVRVLCRSLVEQGRAAGQASLSHPADTVEGAVDEGTARAKSGGEQMGGEQERIDALEAEVRTLRAALETVAAVSASAASFAMHADAGDQGVADDLGQRGIAG